MAEGEAGKLTAGGWFLKMAPAAALLITLGTIIYAVIDFGHEQRGALTRMNERLTEVEEHLRDRAEVVDRFLATEERVLGVERSLIRIENAQRDTNAKIDRLIEQSLNRGGARP